MSKEQPAKAPIQFLNFTDPAEANPDSIDGNATPIKFIDPEAFVNQLEEIFKKHKSYVPISYWNDQKN